MSASALAATRALRDASHLQWYLVPLFAFVVYFYCSEAATVFGLAVGKILQVVANRWRSRPGSTI
jgi:hypothetical protein